MKKVIPPGRHSKFHSEFSNSELKRVDPKPHMRILGGIEPHIRCDILEDFTDKEGRKHNAKNSPQWIPMVNTADKEVGRCGV